MFDNIVVLFGMPRSGTTIVSRLIANHSRVQKIIEPYQSRRDSGYCETDPERLCADFDVAEQPTKSLLVKETATRSTNIEYLGGLLEASSRANYRAAYIFVLRSPLEAFLSQVDAVANLWSKKSNFRRSAQSLAGFWTTFLSSMQHYAAFALRFHRRFVVYDSFVRQPAQEIGGAMGLFGYPLEAAQMDLSKADKSFGGDPNARRSLAAPIQQRDHFRIAAVESLTKDFADVREFQAMRGMHEYIKAISGHQPPSEDIVRDLMLIARRGYL